MANNLHKKEPHGSVKCEKVHPTFPHDGWTALHDGVWCYFAHEDYKHDTYLLYLNSIDTEEKEKILRGIQKFRITKKHLDDFDKAKEKEKILRGNQKFRISKEDLDLMDDNFTFQSLLYGKPQIRGKPQLNIFYLDTILSMYRQLGIIEKNAEKEKEPQKRIMLSMIIDRHGFRNITDAKGAFNKLSDEEKYAMEVRYRFTEYFRTITYDTRKPENYEYSFDLEAGQETVFEDLYLIDKAIYYDLVKAHKKLLKDFRYLAEDGIIRPHPIYIAYYI